MVPYKNKFIYTYVQHICVLYICMYVYICTNFEPLKKTMHILSNINVTDIISSFSDYWFIAVLLGMKMRPLVTKSLSPLSCICMVCDEV